LVISGLAISTGFDNEYMHQELAQMLLAAKAVVVYRSSPGQKAQVVKFVRQHAGNKTILAVGDGANDVDMI
jgi:P-type E1-E2 ATPase